MSFCSNTGFASVCRILSRSKLGSTLSDHERLSCRDDPHSHSFGQRELLTVEEVRDQNNYAPTLDSFLCGSEIWNFIFLKSFKIKNFLKKLFKNLKNSTCNMKYQGGEGREQHCLPFLYHVGRCLCFLCHLP